MESLAKKCEEELESHGFVCASTSSMRSCFDIIASRKGRLVLIKLVDNINSLSKTEAESLKKLKSFFDAEILVTFAGGRQQRGRLFTRHGISCVEQGTLESILDNKPVAKAGRFIKERYTIDSAELKRVRSLYGMSIRELSEKAGISKDTIFRYEQGRSGAKRQSAEKLEHILGVRISSVDGSVEKPQSYSYKKLADRLDVGFLDVGAPFDIVGKRHSRFEIARQADPRTMAKIAFFYRELLDVLPDDYRFFMVKKKDSGNLKGIPLLTQKEVAKAKTEKELIDIILGQMK